MIIPRPLFLAAFLISTNLSHTVNARPSAIGLVRRRDPMEQDGGDAGSPIAEKYTCNSIIAIDKIRKEEGDEEIQITDNIGSNNNQGGRLLRKGDKKKKKKKIRRDFETDEDFVCELKDGTVVAINATDEQLMEMRSALRDGSLVSQVSTIDVEMTTTTDEPDSGFQAIGKEKRGKGRKAKLPSGSIKVQMKTKSRRLKEHAQRRLGTLFRTNRMLVILVNDKDGRMPALGANETSDKIFGTFGDMETPRVQLSGCSNGQTSLTPDSGDQAINSLMDAPGVVTVDIPISIQPFDGPKIENAAIEAAKQKLGTNLPGNFDFVAIVIEDCLDSSECGFAAYAYLNSWKSLYIQDYFTYPAIVTHELGHNFNFGHSGRERTYDDWSCSMGNALWGDNLDKMCFNPAKNWQIAHHGAWYADHKLLLDPFTDPNSSHILVGVSEYGLIDDVPSAIAVLKLETHTVTDFFIGFNRANGQNADNRLSSDEVTLIEAGNNGEGYSESKFIAGLKQGENYTIARFGGSNEGVTITVNEIDTSSSPGYADVSIILGDGSHTPAPTPYCDGKWLKVTVDTDNYPQETSWEVMHKCGRNETIMSGGEYTEAGTTYEEEECVPDSQYEFIIRDTYGDGLCCSWGDGSFSVEYGGNVILSGGEFGTSDGTTFGSCLITPTPTPTPTPTTSQPTNMPTSSPTSAPTPLPSASPTNTPSADPTSSPTKTPKTPLPTSFPTSAPTAMPTQEATHEPTSDGDTGGDISKEFITPNLGEATDKAKGIVFMITAKSKDVIISALGLVGVGKDAKKSDVRIYSQAGSHDDFPDKGKGKKSKKGKSKGMSNQLAHEDFPDQGKWKSKSKGKGKINQFESIWTEHIKEKLIMDPQEIVDIALEEEITIPAGETVSVYVLSKKGLAYKKTSTSNSAATATDQYASNDDFVLSAGTTTKKEFKKYESDDLAEFAGRITYQTGIAS